MLNESLIIGAESLLGNNLLRYHTLRNEKCIGTSRNIKEGFFYLDINLPNIESLLPSAKIVYYCAAINGFDNCNKNPNLAIQTNIISTLNIAKKYIADGAQFVFLSSSSVFGNYNDSPTEKSELNPNTLYGFCKTATEVGLQLLAREYNNEIAIIRLTKVLSTQTPFIQSLRQKLEGCKNIETIDNLLYSPISIEYACEAIISIGKGNKKGIFHFSGEQVTSQTSLAKKIAAFISKPTSLITEISMIPNSNFNQCHHLSMVLTTAATNIKPQPISDLVKDLCKA